MAPHHLCAVKFRTPTAPHCGLHATHPRRPGQGGPGEYRSVLEHAGFHTFALDASTVVEATRSLQHDVPGKRNVG